jgi:hypothetical protein
MEDDILSRDILFNNASDHIHYMGAHVSKEYAVKTFDFLMSQREITKYKKQEKLKIEIETRVNPITRKRSNSIC